MFFIMTQITSSSKAVIAHLARHRRFQLFFTSWRSFLNSFVWVFCIFLYVISIRYISGLMCLLFSWDFELFLHVMLLTTVPIFFKEQKWCMNDILEWIHWIYYSSVQESMLPKTWWCSKNILIAQHNGTLPTHPSKFLCLHLSYHEAWLVTYQQLYLFILTLLCISND